jgi:hypothetical protein
MDAYSDRDLTTDEQAMAAALRAALQPDHRSRGTSVSISDLASSKPEVFFAAAVWLLDRETTPGGRQNPYACLLDRPEFLLQLIRPDRFSRPQMLDVCRRLKRIDDALDVRLASLLPGRNVDPYGLEPDVVVRVLDMLNEISPGPRLILILNHLTQHADQRIAAKATLLVGGRIRNHHWVQRHLTYSDPRVRASLVEALWGHNTPAARKILWASLQDENNRVVGNALVGLYLLREVRAVELVYGMLRDARPSFRWTAAWAMGKMGRPEFTEPLRLALSDVVAGVRQAAMRALVAIQLKTRRAEQNPEAAKPPASSESSAQAPAGTDGPIGPGPPDSAVRLDGRYTASA